MDSFTFRADHAGTLMKLLYQINITLDYNQNRQKPQKNCSFGSGQYSVSVNDQTNRTTSQTNTSLPYHTCRTLPRTLERRAAFCSPARLVQIACRTRRLSSRALNMTAAARLELMPQQLRPLVSTERTSRLASQHAVSTRRPNFTRPDQSPSTILSVGRLI